MCANTMVCQCGLDVCGGFWPVSFISAITSCSISLLLFCLAKSHVFCHREANKVHHCLTLFMCLCYVYNTVMAVLRRNANWVELELCCGKRQSSIRLTLRDPWRYVLWYKFVSNSLSPRPLTGVNGCLIRSFCNAVVPHTLHLPALLGLCTCYLGFHYSTGFVFTLIDLLKTQRHWHIWHIHDCIVALNIVLVGGMAERHSIVQNK